MPDIKIKIKNAYEIKQAFNAAPRLMVKELNTAIKKSIFSIQRDSMMNTPVATGRLRSSTSSLFSNLKGQVGTNTNYDIYVHDGTKFMKARPYLADAVEDNEKSVNDLFTKAVDNVLSAIGRAT